MKKQYIAAVACLAAGAIGFATVYTTQMFRKNKDAADDTQQIESTITSKELEHKESLIEQKPTEATEVKEPETEQAEVAQQPQEAELHFDQDSVANWPVKGDVVLPYSMDKTIYFPTLKQYQYNRGMVIKADVGTEVLSAAPGKVADLYDSRETGTTLVVDMGDGYYATYGQLAEVSVAIGDTVEAGTPIGKVAEPSSHYIVEGSNIYFSLEKDGQALNPMDFLGSI